MTRTVQIKCNNDLSGFQLSVILNFVLTESKLSQGPVKFAAHSISYFVINIIAVLVQQSGLEYVKLPVISLACALHIHIVIMKC